MTKLYMVINNVWLKSGEFISPKTTLLTSYNLSYFEYLKSASELEVKGPDSPR